MLFKTLFILSAVLLVSQASPVILDVVRDEDGQEYALWPIDGETILPFESHRQKRQTISVGAQPGALGGTRVTADVAGTLYEKNGHRLDGNANWARTYKQPEIGTGPVTVGGGLQYSHDRANLGLNAQHTKGFGTDVGATGGANLWRSPDRRSSLDANAYYSRHFGGPFGTGRPNYGGGLTFGHRF